MGFCDKLIDVINEKKTNGKSIDQIKIVIGVEDEILSGITIEELISLVERLKIKIDTIKEELPLTKVLNNIRGETNIM